MKAVARPERGRRLTQTKSSHRPHRSHRQNRQRNSSKDLLIVCVSVWLIATELTQTKSATDDTEATDKIRENLYQIKSGDCLRDSVPVCGQSVVLCESVANGSPWQFGRLERAILREPSVLSPWPRAATPLNTVSRRLDSVALDTQLAAAPE